MKRFFTFLVLALPVFLIAQPTVNGDLSDPEYVVMANKLNGNMGFGPDIDVTQLVYYSDPGARVLYIGVKSRLNNASNDGIGLWLNLTDGAAPIGVPACNPLGVAMDDFGNTPGHYMSANGGANPFFADFEVDFLFAYNPGLSATDCYLDFMSVVGAVPIAAYLGNCGQSGASTTFLEPLTGLSFTFAFQNGGGNNGMEMAIDYNSTSFAPEDLEAFAFVVSATSFFSDVTVPGNVTAGNLGFGPDFCGATGGPWHTTLVPVPVELSWFNGQLIREDVHLRWATATEQGSDHFAIERSTNLQNWSTIGEVEAAGYSLSEEHYVFVDEEPHAGINYYRLRQVDEDGTTWYSEVISVSTPDVPSQGTIYPNPVEEELIISLDEPASVIIYDSAGRVVFSQDCPAGESALQLGARQAGLYWVQAVSARGSDLIREVLIVK